MKKNTILYLIFSNVFFGIGLMLLSTATTFFMIAHSMKSSFLFFVTSLSLLAVGFFFYTMPVLRDERQSHPKRYFLLSSVIIILFLFIAEKA